MSRIPFALPDPRLEAQLARIRDVEGKVPRVLQELGPIAGRRVVVVGGAAGSLGERLREFGAEITVQPSEADLDRLPPASADVVVALSERLGTPAVSAEGELAPIERVLDRPGRLLVMLHYGRDDVSRLKAPAAGDPRASADGAITTSGAPVDRVGSGERGADPHESAAVGAGTSELAADAPGDRAVADTNPAEYGALRQRDRWFLAHGFKMRVIHGWWTFSGLDDAADFLGAAFGATGAEVAAGMRRPRLSYKVVVYHRSFERPQDAPPRPA